MVYVNCKLNEKIVVGGGIRLTIVRVKANEVRIGITAPPEIPIHREEIYRRIKNSSEPVPAATALQQRR